MKGEPALVGRRPFRRSPTQRRFSASTAAASPPWCRPASSTAAAASIEPRTTRFRMAAEDSKDILKNVDWKTMGGAVTTESSKPIVKKRIPKKIRQVPDCYFLPWRSWPSALAIYGAVCAAGVGAGMLLEVWINKKIKEDSGIIWEMDK